jgi:hypothetical protein
LRLHFNFRVATPMMADGMAEGLRARGTRLELGISVNGMGSPGRGREYHLWRPAPNVCESEDAHPTATNGIPDRPLTYGSNDRFQGNGKWRTIVL